MTRVGYSVTLCVLALAGCASESSEQDASQVATRFLEATTSSDGATACALLLPKTRQDLLVSEGQPCAESLPMDRIHGIVRAASVWSDWAKVTTDQGALFLTEYESGWLVAAAGCESGGDAPYRCVVGG